MSNASRREFLKSSGMVILAGAGGAFLSPEQYLLAKGIDPTRVSIVSYGSDHPVCWEKTTQCRAKNRRADVVVKKP